MDWAAEWADEVMLLRGGRVLRQGTPSFLTDPELMRSAGLRLPRVARLFRQWSGWGAETVPTTVEEAVTCLERLGSQTPREPPGQ